jgi:signal peptidase II
MKAESPKTPREGKMPEAEASPPVGAFLRPGLAVAAGVFVIDQISKWAIQAYVFPPRCVQPPNSQPDCSEALLPFFDLSLVYNKGVTFGLFEGQQAYVLSAIALAVTVILVFWLRKAETRMLALALGSVIGGAVGNVVDRLRLEAVVDFLDFHIAGYHWPAFNIADCGVVIGVGFIVIDGLIAGRGKKA